MGATYKLGSDHPDMGYVMLYAVLFHVNVRILAYKGLLDS